jgi:rSAM/selenodomain-associated transferase 1
MPPSFPDILLLFLKAPRPGTVKTRLAAEIGAEKALQAYRALVAHQLAALRGGPWAVKICFAPADAEAEFRRWLGGDPALAFEAQCEGGLGERLARASESAFVGGARRIALLGGDCPALDAGRIVEALNRLSGPERADAVFGPAADGGYTLLALSAAHPALFHEVPWSSSDTLRVSLERAAAARLRVELLPEVLEDVDDLASWRRARNAHPALAAACPDA